MTTTPDTYPKPTDAGSARRGPRTVRREATRQADEATGVTGRQLLMFAAFVGIPALTVGLAWCRARITERAGNERS